LILFCRITATEHQSLLLSKKLFILGRFVKFDTNWTFNYRFIPRRLPSMTWSNLVSIFKSFAFWKWYLIILFSLCFNKRRPNILFRSRWFIRCLCVCFDRLTEPLCNCSIFRLFIFRIVLYSRWLCHQKFLFLCRFVHSLVLFISIKCWFEFVIMFV
jgi:hypothetical protein